MYCVKQCKIEPKLLLITNRKSHTGFAMTYKSLTLNDLKWNVSSYKWPYLGNCARQGQGYYNSLIESSIRPFRLNENH